MGGRCFTLLLVMSLAVFVLGLCLLMSGIAIRPWGFGDAFDLQRTIGGVLFMLGALTVALFQSARSTIPRNLAKTAKRGHVLSQFNLSLMYEQGVGVDKDDAVGGSVHHPFDL